MTNYDVAVLGAGPAGNSAAQQVALHGGKACLIEASDLGGTCLNVGCMPTKAMLAGSELYHRAGRAEAFGLDIQCNGVDSQAYMGRINGIVGFLKQAITDKFAQVDGIDVVQGRGRLAGEGQVIVDTNDGEKSINARSVVIATGSRPNRPDMLPWESDRVVTNVEAVKRTDLPESVLVLGGGALGCEFACLYSELGIPTYIVEMAETLLPRLENDVSQAAERFLEETGVDVRVGVRVEDVCDRGDQLTIHLDDGDALNVDMTLVAVGRSPDLDGLGLEVCGVEVEDGVIAVDERCRTSVDDVYAAGDVAELRRHSHLAARMGRIAGDNIMGVDVSDDRRIVPVGVYIHPEIACVGLCGEDEPRDLPGTIQAYTYDFERGGMALLVGQKGGRLKVLADRHSGRIVGGSWIGAHAVDLIHELTLAMRHELTLDDIDQTIHAHPGFAEALRGVAESWRNDSRQTD
jgi:dihydrolipoamide dehydrogenase